VWELIWLMVIMKIPILYLCWVVYWAIKSEPKPEQPASLVPALDDGSGPAAWRPRRRPRRPGPHGGGQPSAREHGALRSGSAR
jgi:hypothetical protein